jgi:outer membrane receptor protein involved in Fe transport
MLALILWLAAAAAGEAASGNVSGRILSRTGEPLSGVVVTLSQEAGGFSMVRVTDGQGAFVFREVPRGTYRLVASSPRYQAATVEPVLVDGEREMRVDIPMSLPRFAETVEIRADAPSEEDDNPVPPDKIEIRQMDLLPLANDRFQDAFPLLPGVVRDPEGKLSFSGARPSQSILLVNGTNVTDPVTGDFAIEIPLKAIEAVEVTEIPYSAEYGRVTGAVSEVKTRGGTDEWDIDTGDLLPKPNIRDGKIKGLKTFVPQIGVSGPIEKGKLWLSQGLAYRYLRTRIHDLSAGEDERVLESYDTFTQIDWRMADNHDLTTTFSYFPVDAHNLGLNALTTSEATPEFQSFGWNAAISERSRLGASLFETTLAVKEYNLSLRPKSDSASILTPDGLRQNYFSNLERDTGRVDVMTSVTRAMPDLFGQHVLKAGGSVAHSRFQGMDRSLPIRVVDAGGRLVRQVDFLGDPAIEGTDVQVAAFVQDRWRVGPRLGIEAGLRYDYDRIVGEHQVAPRFAMAASLDRSGRTVLRGGLGIFYDHVFLYADGFERLQRRVETSFGPDGAPLGPPVEFENRISPDGLESPRSFAWNVELDRELRRGVEVRVGYRERHGTKELLVDPRIEEGRGTLLLSSTGGSRNRELGVVFRFSGPSENELFLAYSKSRSTGDLNHLTTLYQNLRAPLVYANEDSVFDLDVPHRFLLWGTWKLPWDIVVAPGLEWRSGFPYSVFDERYRPIGERNRGGRFPTFFALDLRVTRGLTVKGRRIRVGIQVFNLGSHFNPRDVIAYTGSPRFGSFLNSVDMGVGLRVSLEK